MRAILTYHSIDSTGSPISVAPRAFVAHARWLASGRVRVVPLDTLAAAPDRDDGRDVVAITFDDGFANFARYAAPPLCEYALPATVFVVSGHVGRTNAWGGRSAPNIPTLPLLDWPALEPLAARGFTIGAHTRTHPSLDARSGAALAEEILGGAEDLKQRLGVRPTSFAYPYGATSADATILARKHFACAVTTELRPLRTADDMALLPRLDSFYFRDPARLEAWGTIAFAVRLRVRAAARMARRRAERVRRAAVVPSARWAEGTS